MKLSEALLCTLALTATGVATHGTADASIMQRSAVQDTVAKSPDRKARLDTTARTPRLPRRKAPKRQPRYCPACGMG